MKKKYVAVVALTICSLTTVVAQTPIIENKTTLVPNNTMNAQFHVGNGPVLFDGTLGLIPATGAGTRMMWYPAKSAFRAGNITGTQWDDASIGFQSVAFGVNNTASGNNSFVHGVNSSATALNSFAMGQSTTASAAQSFAFGLVASSSGQNGIAMGSGANVSGMNGVAFTNSIASASNSRAIGVNTTTASYAMTAVGQYNYAPTSYNLTAFVTTDPLFVIGNGLSAGSRSNAVTVFKNSNVNIGTSQPTGTTARLDVDGGAGQAFLSMTNYPTNTGYNAVFQVNQFNTKALVVRNTAITGSEVFTVYGDGRTRIGNQSPQTLAYSDALLAVNGKFVCRSAYVQISDWADTVFTPQYNLMPIAQLGQFVQANHHLPDVPTSQEAMANGMNVADMNVLLLRKVEELTLYMLQQEQRLALLEAELRAKQEAATQTSEQK